MLGGGLTSLLDVEEAEGMVDGAAGADDGGRVCDLEAYLREDLLAIARAAALMPWGGCPRT